MCISTQKLTWCRHFNVILDYWNIYTYEGVQKVRGPTKKENEFYDETRCEACDVSKTTPDAVTSQSVLLLGSGCWLL